MLTFEKTEDCYRITEKIMGARATKTTIVEYKHDLSKMRVNNDPWRKPSKSCIEWFNKYHLPKFEEVE